MDTTLYGLQTCAARAAGEDGKTDASKPKDSVSKDGQSSSKPGKRAGRRNQSRYQNSAKAGDANMQIAAISNKRSRAIAEMDKAFTHRAHADNNDNSTPVQSAQHERKSPGQVDSTSACDRPTCAHSNQDSTPKMGAKSPSSTAEPVTNPAANKPPPARSEQAHPHAETADAIRELSYKGPRKREVAVSRTPDSACADQEDFQVQGLSYFASSGTRTKRSLSRCAITVADVTQPTARDDGAAHNSTHLSCKANTAQPCGYSAVDEAIPAVNVTHMSANANRTRRLEGADALTHSCTAPPQQYGTSKPDFFANDSASLALKKVPEGSDIDQQGGNVAKVMARAREMEVAELLDGIFNTAPPKEFKVIRKGQRGAAILCVSGSVFLFLHPSKYMQHHSLVHTVSVT